MAKIDKDKLFEKISTAMEKAGKAAGSVALMATDIGKATAMAAGKAGAEIKKEVPVAAEKVKTVAKKSGEAVSAKYGELKSKMPVINVEDILRTVMKVPIVKIDRYGFLHKELIKYYPEETVRIALDKNPAYAGIDRDTINKIATQVINFETNKVTTISFAAGLPGGVAMLATVPADVAQYFTFVLRTMQKLAYLYGFEEFEFSEEEISDDVMNQVMIFLGVMFGVQGASQALKALAEVVAKNLTKTLAQKALTKTAIYPIVKSIAKAIGVKMTKQIFAEGVGKTVPILGGVVAGGLTYVTFKPCCIKLKNSFKDLKLSDPEFYKQNEDITVSESEIIDIDVDAIITDIESDNELDIDLNINDTDSAVGYEVEDDLAEKITE